MARSLEEVLKAIIGDYVFQIAQLQAVVEAQEDRIKQLTPPPSDGQEPGKVIAIKPIPKA